MQGLQKPLVWFVGGSDVHLRLQFADALHNRGFDVAAVGTASASAAFQGDMSFHRYDLGDGLSPLADLRALRQLVALLSWGEPDIVHAFDTKPGLLTPLAAQRAGIRHVVRTITGMGYVFSGQAMLAHTLRKPYEVLQKLASSRSELTVFQNSDDYRWFVENGIVRPERAALIPGSGVDLAELDRQRLSPAQAARQRAKFGLGEDRIVVMMIARMLRTKGVMEFLGAAQALRREDQRLAFLLVGPIPQAARDGVSASEIAAFADDVDHLGFREDVVSLLSCADIFVLPTYYREGVPRVLLEAATLGLPIVTTDMPGSREVVSDDENGFLVPPRNTAALAQAIRKLADDSALRGRLGRAGRHIVEARFALPRVADAYAAVYRRLLL